MAKIYMAKEYIDRAALIENLNRFAPEHYNALINMLITKQPAVDVVEVVRCKDCKYFDPWFGDVGICRLHSFTAEPEPSDVTMNSGDFCSYGERKEE